MLKYTMLFKYNNKIEIAFFFPFSIKFFCYSGPLQIVSLAVKQHVVCTLLSNQNRTNHKTSSKNNDWYVRYYLFGCGVLHSHCDGVIDSIKRLNV